MRYNNNWQFFWNFQGRYVASSAVYWRIFVDPYTFLTSNDKSFHWKGSWDDNQHPLVLFPPVGNKRPLSSFILKCSDYSHLSTQPDTNMISCLIHPFQLPWSGDKPLATPNRKHSLCINLVVYFPGIINARSGELVKNIFHVWSTTHQIVSVRP